MKTKNLNYLLQEICKVGGYAYNTEQAHAKGLTRYLALDYQDQKHLIVWVYVSNMGREKAFGMTKRLPYAQMEAFMEGILIGLNKTL